MAEKRQDEKRIEVAKKRLKKCQEAEHELRELSRDDFRFYKGDQWPSDIKTSRQKQGSLAVCMTVNRVKPAVKQITNDQRQNRGAIKVSPVDSGADPETAQVLQGVIRHIEYNSDADVVYDTAFEHAVIAGFGFMRVLTEFEDQNSFRQCIKLKRFRNPFQVYLDPSHSQPDGSDAKYAFIVTKIPKEEYEEEYPGSELASLNMEDAVRQYPEWVSEDGITVAEYYHTESEKDTLYQLKDGRTVLRKDLDEAPDQEEIFDEREVEVERIRWFKFNAAEILDETEWLGKYIPIIKVSGDEMEIDGGLVLEGLIRQAKDPQRMLNYWRSKQTEAIALAPKAPWVAAEGQLEGHEAEWQRSNVENLAVLQYKPLDVAGHLVGTPTRQVAEPAIAAITAAGIAADQDFRDVTQLHEASYGERSNEKSGRAILARQQQGQTGNFHFVDNLTRARRHVGRILVDLIPKIYHEKGRILRIIGEDGTQESMALGQPFKHHGGVERIYDLGVGRYDVIMETGPDFGTKRKEAAENMATIFGAVPELFKLAGDLYFKAQDWPYANEIAERAKALLPPELREQQNGQKQPIPPQVQQQLEQMGQMVETLSKELNAKTEIIERETQKLESQERIEQMRLEVKRLEIQARMMETQEKLDSQETIALLKADIEAMKAQIQVSIQERAQEARATAEMI